MWAVARDRGGSMPLRTRKAHKTKTPQYLSSYLLVALVGYGRHLHSAHEWTDGKRPPERKSFYEAVAKTLRGAEEVAALRVFRI